MHSVLRAPGTEPLAAVVGTLEQVRAQRGEAPVHGFATGLLAPPGALVEGWFPATNVVHGYAVDELLDAARERWQASPHAAAALAFKSYAYWLTLPAVVGYASARRVPLVAPDNVLVRLHGTAPFVELGLRRPEVAVLASDPVTALGWPGVRVLPDEPALLEYLRSTLLEAHLAPLMEQLHERVRVGQRTLLGSVASGVAYALVRSADALPGGVAGTAAEILDALGLADLVEVTSDLQVRRRTCCLAFTLPEPKLCSGCCIK